MLTHGPTVSWKRATPRTDVRSALHASTSIPRTPLAREARRFALGLPARCSSAVANRAERSAATLARTRARRARSGTPLAAGGQPGRLGSLLRAHLVRYADERGCRRGASPHVWARCSAHTSFGTQTNAAAAGGQPARLGSLLRAHVVRYADERGQPARLGSSLCAHFVDARERRDKTTPAFRALRPRSGPRRSSGRPRPRPPPSPGAPPSRP